jgi:2-polyprenyl-3-methyl-5-hydroxy-6-metoxy-1,4-benzoquinol methylase
MRTSRVVESNLELDELEREWWNAKAQTIEKIWAQNQHFQKVIRLPYLSKMREFFLSGARKLPVIILEIGCGSGWVCRSVTDEKIHVIGTDFSEGQLKIARNMAKLEGKEKYCTYELADASTFNKDVDGVVIHALLHHLSTNELKFFFEQFSQLQSGTKIFMYEPIFFAKQNGKKAFVDKVLNKIIYEVKTFAINKAEKKGKKDVQLNLNMKEIFEEAEKKGWYISPKEIPFYENELENYMSPMCTLQKKYIVNKTDLDISQALTLNGYERPPFLFSKILIPLVRKLDKLSFKGKFTHYIPPNQHLFVCFEWIKK